MVITGAGGQVGRFLAGESGRRGYRVRALTHRELDITDPGAALRHIAAGDVVVNCAALSNVDAAENDPDRAHAVNTAGPENLARACAEAGARLIHISTDYVFGGGAFGGGAFGGGAHPPRPYEIDDAPDPLSVYGRTKLGGERAVLSALPGAHVVRTSWVYTGDSGSDFVAVMRGLAATDRTVDVVADQTGSPTFVGDLVSALFEVIERDVAPGILHVVNGGEASRFEQARAVFAELGADPDRVRPVGTEDVPRPARRPAYSALSMVDSARAGLTPLRPWRDALTEALARSAGPGPLPSTP